MQMWLHQVKIAKGTSHGTQGCLREQLIASKEHSSKLATRAPCTTRGDQTGVSLTWVKVEMESWYMELHALAQEHHYASRITH